jgi:hypothetical protein
MHNIIKSQQTLLETDYPKLWENSLIIFDTNTLLNAYRLPESARLDFLKILKNDRVKNRIWLPFQALLEYSHNRLTVIGEQKGKFSQVEKIINEGIAELDKVHNNLQTKIDDLQLKKRHSVINPEKVIDEKLFDDVKHKLKEFMSELTKLDKTQSDVNDIDNIGNEILRIFNGKTGVSFNKEDLEKIYKEGEARYSDEIPPGYKDLPKDKEKPNYYLHENKKFLRKFGDLILWKEIIKKAKDENLEYIILVTNDNKIDWWTIKRGKTLGPRYELLDEIYFEAPNLKIFHMYDSYNFMRYSKEYLKIDINEQSMVEAKDLNEIQKNESEFAYTFIKNLVSKLSNEIKVNILFPKDFDRLCINIPESKISPIIYEILSNVKDHSEDKTCKIDFTFEGSFFILIFSNKVEAGQTEFSLTSRKYGLNQITTSMHPYGFTYYHINNDHFHINLSFKKELVDILPF